MSPFTGAMVLLAVSLASWMTTGLARAVAVRGRWFDKPNRRSAHSIPTPRLGGIGIMTAVLPAGAFVSVACGARGLYVPLVATAIISILGLVDDLRPLSARIRLLAQIAAAAIVVWAAGPRVEEALAFVPGIPSWAAMAVGVVWITWLTNLFNFMDGVDGLAGGQAFFGGVAIGLAAFEMGYSSVGWMSLAIAAAAAGFLVHNFPPASIFMGDVGSTALGFLFASLPFAAEPSALPAEIVGLALALFIFDATVTLLRRVARGERLGQAHRSHYYQRPLAVGIPHRRITLVAYVGMVVMAAIAVFATSVNQSNRWLLVALAVCVCGVLAAVAQRAGRTRDP